MRAAGICIGASNISWVEIDERMGILNSSILSHEGDINNVLKNVLNILKEKGYQFVALTGRKFRNNADLPWLSEPEAVERAFKFINKDKIRFNALVSTGAELFIAYISDEEGNISGVRTNNKCASGTGEFFIQQLRRMNLSLEDALSIKFSDKAYKVSGRCSVFCKSDCTHALNKGENIANIVSGLCEMMGKKVLELLVKVKKENIMLVGGVALNKNVINFLKNYIDNIVVPKEAPYFEATGAALFALENKIINTKSIGKRKTVQYNILPPLISASHLVDFIQTDLRAPASPQDQCILGLDVGSTTTKAVILRIKDDKILASVYLRTEGNPIEASRRCYKILSESINEPIEIIGLGVTGSGRQIVGLHAMTDGIINEIIAHAKAAVYFDKDVDTIFEIGGQDAKYTYIINGLPADYAMNEACSAGTGSFLEESCKETLGIEVEDIASIALKSQDPPNFNEQCAAFISSDIKTACYEGLRKEDIVGGLVYSICLNYLNKVKGNRIYGDKIFMQGGVCYNRAVPLAMASLLGKKIIVPPEPGLMGAFGIAIEIKEKLKNGLLKEKKFDLVELVSRDVHYHKSFKCKGEKQSCDRNCEIKLIKVEGKNYPFGGACNKYYNLNYENKFDTKNLNLVRTRQEKLFEGYDHKISNKKTIGINKSFLIHYFFPLYYNFFSELGLKVILPDSVNELGIQKKGSYFCYPAEIAHGFFQNLLEKKPDYIFLPQITEIKSKNINCLKDQQSNCVITQAEPYYLMTAFQEELNKDKVLAPVIDFSKGYEKAIDIFLDIAKKIGFSQSIARQAYIFACKKQRDFENELKNIGMSALKELMNNPDKIGIVILGRDYNAFPSEANMAIPDKFASRGFITIPFDCLPYEDEPDDFYMNWPAGQLILKAARFIKKNSNLFATFITNFSCGPDAFIIDYVREIMDKRPLLILEIDSHTADAGINTRIEAFLDIITNSKKTKIKEVKKSFTPAQIVADKKIYVISSKKEKLKIDDKRVKILIPPMGELGPQALSAAFRGIGINSIPLPPSDLSSLKEGRSNTSCKECLPLTLCTGGLLKYIKENSKNDLLVYFMPTTAGSCRFSQYNIFLKNLIKKKEIENLAVLSITSENGYVGLGKKFNSLALNAIIISDVMYDIKNALRVLAKDEELALNIFNSEWAKIIHCLEKNDDFLENQLKMTALELKKIPLKYPLKEAKFLALIGEIYIRRDPFCCESLIERLIQREFVIKIAPIIEWLYYVDWTSKINLFSSNFDVSKTIEFLMKRWYLRKQERKIKKILSNSGLYHFEMLNIKEIISYGKHFINESLTGESILGVGVGLKEIINSACGVINIGPFACLPTRIVESILSKNMNLKTKMHLDGKLFFDLADGNQDLPFLSIEIDGNPFPPIIEAKIDAFCLQADRFYNRIKKINQMKVCSK